MRLLLVLLLVFGGVGPATAQSLSLDLGDGGSLTARSVQLIAVVGTERV